MQLFLDFKAQVPIQPLEVCMKVSSIHSSMLPQSFDFHLVTISCIHNSLQDPERRQVTNKMLPQQCSRTQQTKLRGLKQNLFIVNHVFAGQVPAWPQTQARSTPPVFSLPSSSYPGMCSHVEGRNARELSRDTGFFLMPSLGTFDQNPMQTQHL